MCVVEYSTHVLRSVRVIFVDKWSFALVLEWF